MLLLISFLIFISFFIFTPLWFFLKLCNRWVLGDRKKEREERRGEREQGGKNFISESLWYQLLFFAWLRCKAPINLASAHRSDWRWGIRMKKKKKYREVETSLWFKQGTHPRVISYFATKALSKKVWESGQNQNRFFFPMRKSFWMLHSVNPTSHFFEILKLDIFF